MIKFNYTPDFSNKDPKSICYNEDCNLIMKKYPDNYFDLAVCDIPYGINVGKMAYLQETKTRTKQRNGSKLNANKNKKPYKIKDWDYTTPDQKYFDELKRISKNQIIFGVEYVNWTGLKKGRLRWNKLVPKGMSFKNYELAYCSFIDEEIEIKLLWAGMQQAKSIYESTTPQGNKKLNEKRIHPTHKPVMLYDIIYSMFGFSEMKIIDTHLGSGSNRISAYKFGFEFVSSEIDTEYYNAQEIRFKDFKNNFQNKLF